MQYTLKAFAPDAAEPLTETVAHAHDRDAVDACHGLLRQQAAIRQFEVWRDERRIAVIERVV